MTIRRFSAPVARSQKWITPSAQAAQTVEASVRTGDVFTIRPFFLSESGQDTFTHLQEACLPNQDDTKKSAGKADSLAGNLCGSLASAGYVAWQLAGGYYLGALPGLFVLEHFFTSLLHQSLETHKGHRQDTDGN